MANRVPCLPSLDDDPLAATLARPTNDTNERLLDTLARPTMWVAVHALALMPSPCMRSLSSHLPNQLSSHLPNQPAVWPCSAAKPAARCRVICCDAEDPWLLLGVSCSATDAQIRRAFRHQARKLHPDVCTDPEAPEQFRSLVEAFKKLRTDESRARWRTQSRAAYDRRVRGSAKERAARAWGAPDRPRGSTSRPSTSAPSATGVRKTAAERAAQRWREVEERAQAQAQTATTPRSPPRSPPPPPQQQQQQQPQPQPQPQPQQQQSAGSWPHQQSTEPPPQATPAGPLLCEVLLVELRDVRDRTRHHAERAAWRRGG